MLTPLSMSPRNPGLETRVGSIFLKYGLRKKTLLFFAFSGHAIAASRIYILPLRLS
jgi:hypothetical protein